MPMESPIAASVAAIIPWGDAWLLGYGGADIILFTADSLTFVVFARPGVSDILTAFGRACSTRFVGVPVASATMRAMAGFKWRVASTGAAARTFSFSDGGLCIVASNPSKDASAEEGEEGVSVRRVASNSTGRRDGRPICGSGAAGLVWVGMSRCAAAVGVR